MLSDITNDLEIENAALRKMVGGRPVTVAAQLCKDLEGMVSAVEPIRVALQQAAELERHNDALRQWVKDLQSGMWVNCVYCGHRYGPRGTNPVSVVGAPPDMADALRAHVAACEKHPMAAIKKQRDDLLILAKNLLSEDLIRDGDELDAISAEGDALIAEVEASL